MIVGIGVDVVDLTRFERSLARTPALRGRLFGDHETVLRDGAPRQVPSLAARFAAKEALIKALGGSTGVSWHDIVVVSDEQGAPSLTLTGGARTLADARGVARLHLSLSHDGGVAVAYVIAECDDTTTAAPVAPADTARSVAPGTPNRDEPEEAVSA